MVSPPFYNKNNNGSGAQFLSRRRRSIASDSGCNCNHNHRRQRRQYHPLATAFVTPPEISSSEDNNDDNTEGGWERDSGLSSEVAAKVDLLLRGLNPSQVEAVTQPLFLYHDDDSESLSSVVTRVIAGPGSGKTKVLTTRIAHLLQKDPYGKVLAVTFTRKASGEMKERLEKLLMELDEVVWDEAEQNDKDELLEHNHANDNNVSNNNNNNNGIVVQERAQQPGVVDAEGSRNPRGIERVELGTFHSICAKILRFNGELLRDLPSVQRDMSKAEPKWVEKILPGNTNTNNSNRNTDNDEPEMVLVDPEINLNGQYIIIDQGEQIRTLNECLKELKIDLKTTELKPIQLLTTISKMKETFAQNQDPFVDQGNKRPGMALRTARRIYYPYREKLLANNALDFDDLILLTRELLMVNEELRERLHKRWPHVLVDEYQDTSKIQMDLIKLLTSTSLFVVGDADQSIYSWRGAHVGSLEDVATDFSAYGSVRTVFLKENYRSTSNIVRAAEKVISSGQPQSILSEALAEAGETNDKLRELENNEQDKNNYKSDDLRRAMKPKRGAGPSPRVVACDDERAEAKFVVDTILNMTAHGDIRNGDTVALIYRTNAQSRYLEEACVQQNLPYVIRGGAGGFYKRAEIRDCLCFLKWLHNGNDDGSMMRAMKTPTKGIGEKAFSEFKDYSEKVQGFIRQNCPDVEKPTYLDILISMSGEDDIENNDEERSYTLPEGSPLPQDYITKRALNNFLKFSAKMRLIRSKAQTLDLGKLLFFVIEELDLTTHFDAISKSRTEFLERKENVQELRNAAKKYASYGPSLEARQPESNQDDDDVMGVESALASFLDDVALVSDIAEANQDEGSNRLVANLMTIHASKGTEFDCVFVVGLEEGTLPSHLSLQEGAGSVQLEEEKRLCYVAMTRAKTQLILTWRKQVTSFSNWSDSGPKTQDKQRSRFLNAIVSKKSLKKGQRSKKKKTKKSTQGGSSGGSIRNSSTYSGAKQQYGNLNRSGLTGPGRRRMSESRQSPPNASSPPPMRRREPSSSTRRTSTTAASRRRKKPPESGSYGTPSLENLEALRSSLDENLPSAGARRSPPKKRIQPPKPRTTRNSPSINDTNDAVDPMWFFPVGKKVVHMNIGKGTVVEPPPFSSIEDAKVRVLFDNGKTLDFPALGCDIVPDMGNF